MARLILAAFLLGALGALVPILLVTRALAAL